MNDSNQCPNCKKYIIGLWCYTCKDDIRNMEAKLPDFLKNLFKQKGD